MLTPYIAQVLLKTSLYSAVIVYAVIGLLAAIIAWFLPVETLGLQLNQSGTVYIRTVNSFNPIPTRYGLNQTI